MMGLDAKCLHAVDFAFFIKNSASTNHSVQHQISYHDHTDTNADVYVLEVHFQAQVRIAVCRIPVPVPVETVKIMFRNLILTMSPKDLTIVRYSAIETKLNLYIFM